MLTLTTLRSRLPGAVTTLSIAALAAACLLVGRSWLAAHDAALQLSATVEVQNRMFAQADERQRQRDASLAATLAQINAAKQRVNTPAKAVAEIPRALPPLPLPLELQLPDPTPELPNPPAIATVPQVDLKPIYDYLEDCRACQASLAATKENMTDERAKLAAVAAERDAAIKAARGGSFWSRLRHNAKWFAIGTSVAAVASTLGRH